MAGVSPKTPTVSPHEEEKILSVAQFRRFGKLLSTLAQFALN